jgi:hypothetical protein
MSCLTIFIESSGLLNALDAPSFNCERLYVEFYTKSCTKGWQMADLREIMGFLVDITGVSHP